MLDSLRVRWLLAVGLAVVVALAITALFSSSSEPTGKRADAAAAIWKARTGVDLAALPQLHPPHPDSEEARALDALLQPIDLHLGGRLDNRRPDDRRSEESRERDREELDALRDALRASIQAGSTDAQALPPSVVSAIERRAGTLDAVADFVTTHRDVRWREDFGPRPQRSALDTDDHLTLHRLLIGRAFLALERGDTAMVVRMLSTSQQLHRALEQRQELFSQFVAVGVERLHLALLRRGARGLGVTPAEPAEGIRERYLAGMSAEAAVILAGARPDALRAYGERDPGIHAVRLLAGSKIERAAGEAVTVAAEGVEEIRRSQDGCLELAKVRRAPGGLFAGNYFSLNATEAWRRFVILELDRAITAAVLTGRTASPCRSVVLTVSEDGHTRTVEAKGLPSDIENVIGVPSVVTARLDR